MKTTMTLAANMNCSPFDVFEQDTDTVIMVIDFYIELGSETPLALSPQNEPQERIRVNDKTATGGWF